MAGRRGTVSFDNLNKLWTADPRAWLAWVLDVAHADLSTLTSRQRQSLLVDVLRFLLGPFGPGIGGDADHLELPSAAELRQIQEAFRRILWAMAGKAPADHHAFQQAWISQYPALAHREPWIAWPFADQCQYGLVKLIDRLRHIWDEAGYTHPLIQTCTAPKPRSQEPCGRFFLGSRGKRAFCSPACQNRAGTRRFRTQQAGQTTGHVTSERVAATGGGPP